MTNNDLTGVLKTLRYRLALLVLAGLAPVAAHQCYHLVSDRGAQLQAARERSAEIARAGVERFGDAVREAQTVLELMAKVPVVSDGTPERCGDFLRDIERDRPWANGLWVVGENERVICTSVPNGLGVVTSQRPWYRHAVAAKGFTLSDFFIGQVRGVPASNAALPAVAPGSGARQVYAVTMDLSWFGRVAEAIGAKNNAQVTLVDGNGVVLARYPDGERLVGNNFSGHPLIEAGLKQSSGLYEGLDLDGQDRIFSVVALQNTRTHLIVGLDRAQILAAMDAETTWTVLILTAIGALMSMLAWIGGRRIFVAPMETIAGTLQVTLDHIDQGLIMVDAAGRVRVCNRRAQELLDLPDHVIAGQPSFASLVGYQIERGEFETFGDPEALWSAKGGFEGKPRVYERVRPNGHILEISTVPLAGGGAVRTYTDVTDRRAVEQAARQSEEHIRALIDALPQKIWTTRPDGAASYHNRQMIAYHGGSGSGLADWVEASHPDDRERVQKVRDEAMAAGRAFTVEVRLRDAAGAYRWHLLSTAPIQRRGAIVEWVGTSVDIHRIKDTEQALAETTKRADEARRHAEAASDAKTEFLASMSHEIRTPLNGVLGYTELLLAGGPLTEDQRRAIDHIRNAGEALLTVVNDILDFSRIEAGQIDLEPRTFATRNLVDQSLSIVESLAAAKRLDLRADLDPALPPVLVGDDTRVRQVLLNLLNNAIKFTHNGGVMLKISVVEVGTAQTLLRFAVTDTGIGIPADKLPRLFQRFSQVDGSVQREFGGSGLGLAICKRLIERMGGEIGVESREFEGSTFWFTVPFGVGAGQDLLDLAMDAPVPQASRPARILLAEDIRMNQELACAVLTRAGHSVDVVADGTEALMAVQEAHYDLVLMDVQMPVMDGITATRRIRAMDGPQARIPIIAMTANVLPAQVAAFAEAGMNDHIGKPFRRGQLLDAVDRWCAGAGPAGVEAEPDRKSGAEAASFDRAIYDGLAEIVGPEMLSNWISDLRARIATAEACMRTPDDRDALARAAHALVSVSGMMGFMRLSDRSSALEQACPAGSDPGAALRLVQEGGRQVLATLDELDAAGAAAPLRAAG